MPGLMTHQSRLGRFRIEANRPLTIFERLSEFSDPEVSEAAADIELLLVGKTSDRSFQEDEPRALSLRYAHSRPSTQKSSRFSRSRITA